jgi:putative two-component system response regulator
MIMSTKPDLILLDLAMPGIDGYEVCRRSKKDESTKDIPVIFFTASVVTASVEEKAKELKADGFIVKPFNYKELLEKIKSIIG